jgi:hypothetical protein
MSEPPGEQIDSHEPGNFQERESVDEGDDASMASLSSCKHCGKIIINRGALHNHEQRCLERPRTSCKHCGKIIINRGALHNHEQRCLEIQARQRAQDLQEEVRPRTSCKYCGKVIVNGGALHNHEQRCLEIQARQRAQDLQEESRLSAATASAPLPAQQSIIKKARQAALAAAAAEGLELLADASEPSGFAGVQVHGTLKDPRYSARVTLVSSSRQKYRTRVLSNSCTTPEEAALCVARGYRAIARGELLPF